MIPSTFLSGVVFLLLVAPGVLWDLAAKRRRISPKESTFQETSRIVFNSLWLSALSMLVMGIIGYLKPNWMFNIRNFLSDPGEFYKMHPLIIWRSLIIEGAISFGIVGLVHFKISGGRGWRLREVSPWHSLFRLELPDDHTFPHVRVKLLNGSAYFGRVIDYTADFEMVDREIVLGPPLYSKSEGGKVVKVPVEWQRLILPATAIESISLKYKEEPKEGHTM